jgi:hypothetical protein
MYRDYQVDPVLGIFLLDDRVEFLGDSIGYRDFIAGDWLRFRSKLVSISDDPLFPSHASIRDGSPNREDTYEWSNSLELFLPSYGDGYISEIDFIYAKDILQHNGNYFEIQSKTKLGNFRVPGAGTLVEPNLFLSAGWGDKAHNKYFYGSDINESGFTNVAAGLWFALPEEADRNYPIIQARWFETLGAFKDGQYASGRNRGFLFSFIATFGVLD